MRAVILVAGASKRMGGITESTPKTLLKVGNRPILQWMLSALLHEQIQEVIFVCGYLKEQIQQFVHDQFPEIQTTWIENEVYAETNTAYSVWLTREVVLAKEEPILLLNGDVVFDYRAISATLSAGEGNVLATRLDRVAEEEVKVRLDSDRWILEIGKQIAPSSAAGESVGINRLSFQLLSELYPVLEQRIRYGKGAFEFYEVAFNAMIQNGTVFSIADVTPFPVMEVDTVEDYEEVEHAIAPCLIVS